MSYAHATDIYPITVDAECMKYFSKGNKITISFYERFFRDHFYSLQRVIKTATNSHICIFQRRANVPQMEQCCTINRQISQVCIDVCAAAIPKLGNLIDAITTDYLRRDKARNSNVDLSKNESPTSTFPCSTECILPKSRARFRIAR